MMLTGVGGAHREETLSQNYLFVDGNYLRTEFHDHMERFYGHIPPIDFHSLANKMGTQRAYYYDAINYEKLATETEDQRKARVAEREALHHYISGLVRWHVRDGYVRRGDRKKNEQKAVDVQLAVDALEHASRGNIKKANILTGDLDFEPLLASLERMGVTTKLWHVARTTAPSLLAVSDESHHLTIEDFFDIAPPSFRDNYRKVQLHYPGERPERPVFEPERRGTWAGREVTLYRPTNQSNPRLFLARGNELHEPAITFEHPDIEKLELAFNLTFGPLTWQ